MPPKLAPRYWETWLAPTVIVPGPDFPSAAESGQAAAGSRCRRHRGRRPIGLRC